MSFNLKYGNALHKACSFDAAEESLAKDDYRSSPLGLQNTHEQRVSSTLTWSPRDTLSAYVDAGYERISNLHTRFQGRLRLLTPHHS